MQHNLRFDGLTRSRRVGETVGRYGESNGQTSALGLHLARSGDKLIRYVVYMIEQWQKKSLLSPKE
jgi:hypothetical protein